MQFTTAAALAALLIGLGGTAASASDIAGATGATASVSALSATEAGIADVGAAKRSTPSAVRTPHPVHAMPTPSDLDEAAPTLRQSLPDDAATNEARTAAQTITDIALEDLADLSKSDRDALIAFYKTRNGQPAWVSVDGVSKKAVKIVTAAHRADDWGLDADAIVTPSLSLIGSADDRLSRLAEIERRLSVAVLIYARQAISGRADPSEISKYWDQRPRDVDGVAVLTQVASAGSAQAALEGLHPQHPQFEGLRQAYLRMRASGPQKDPVIVPVGATMRKGDSGPRVAKLRERLGVTASTDGSGNDTFDEALHDAVEAFQRARGLEVDGLVGPGTLSALNRSPKDRMKRLLVNMERWRWMPEELGAYRVWANIPEFLVRVMQGEDAIFTERLVAGKLANQTPIFSDEMERVEFHPYWNVPNSIKVKEILPGLRRSTEVLRKSNLRVKLNGREIDPSRVNWSEVDVRRYHIYQPPGGPNVLGYVKFMFPNKHAVYMHDTTSRSLFSRTVRTFSHGCMRIRNPREFARVLLGNDRGWGGDRIDSIIASKVHTPVSLKSKVPVHITYFTARVEADGTVRYFDDHYGHDLRTAMALDGKELPPIVVARSEPVNPGPDLADARASLSQSRASWSRAAFSSDR